MDSEKIRKFISELRKEKNMTQQELADKLNVTDKAISKWENGRGIPDISLIKELANLFRVTEKEILNGERDFKKKEIDIEHHNKVLEVTNLSKSFGKRKVLDNINLDIYEGDIVGLIGPNGIVKEINYLLWYFKEMIICSIPVLCMLCVLFSLSTITLSTSLTASITSILSIISVTIWALISNFNATFLTFLSYTPIPYLGYWFTRYHSRYYIQTISTTPLNDEYGLLISIVVTIVLFLLTILIYNKRDIKN